ncbi:MAG: sensor histidine kinase [Vicinamibacterales bacterium]
MPSKTAVTVPASASTSLPLVRGVARAAVAVLDPALSVNAILEIVAEHARELLGARRASVILSDTAEPVGAGDLHQAMTDHTGRVVGAIRLSGKPGGPFTPLDEEIVHEIAQLASVAIHHAQIRDALRHSEERLRVAVEAGRGQIRHAALNADIGLALTRSATIREMLQHCARAIVEHTDAAFARIWTLDQSRRVLELQASAGMYTHVDGPHSRVPLGQFKIGEIAEERQAYLTNHVVGDPRVGDQEWAEREGIVAFAGFPLIVGEELVGVLGLFAKRPLSDQEFRGLEAAGITVALGVERKQAETARDRALAEVAAERRRLEISNAELDQFAYIASHDLKAPLRGIANLAQWIEEDLQPSLRDETREMLEMLRGRMHRMESLIDGILQFSRAGRLPGRPDTVNVGRLVGEVIDLLAPPPSTTLVIKPGMPTMVTDRLGLQRVFMNLIGNAIKYARGDGARIEIGVHDTGMFYDFFVADNGPGIPAEYHQKIWVIFQALAPRDEVEGTGIGLSIVKKTVEARGGRVRLESAPGEGSTFSFLWPKHLPREDAA